MDVELTVIGKKLLSSDGRNKKVIVVADNKDYVIGLNNIGESLALFAKFKRDGKHQDILINSDSTVQIPLWVLSEGFFEVGLFNDQIATEPFEFEVVESILGDEGIETESPAPKIVEQLIGLVNELKEKTIDETEMKRLIGEYISEHPIDEAGNGISSAEVNENGELFLMLRNGNKVNCGKQGLTTDEVRQMIDETISHIAKFEDGYEVTPKVAAQTLSTKNKLMTDDVRIKEIPTYEVSNQTGTTFYIGE